jgi:hypothetical protein
MKRIILSALVALTALGGVAAADRRPDVRDQRGGVYVNESRPRYQHRPYNQGRYQQGRYQQGRYQQGVRYQQRPHYSYSSRYVYRPTYRYVRRPIFVQRPRIAVRYYNYYQPPQLLVENYAAMPGYFWVAGQWSWNGYEWIWTPGHYEPDPNYSGFYSNSYDPQYYQQNPSYDPNYVY